MWIQNYSSLVEIHTLVIKETCLISWSAFSNKTRKKCNLPRVSYNEISYLGAEYPTLKSQCYLVNCIGTNPKLHWSSDWKVSSRERTPKRGFLTWALNRPQLFHRNALAPSKDRTRELINKQKSAKRRKWQAVVANLLIKMWRPTKLLIITQVSPVLFLITF